jgi:hypothetical protein
MKNNRHSGEIGDHENYFQAVVKTEVETGFLAVL